MTQRVPPYSPLPGPAHPTSVSEAVAVKFSPEAVAEALTQCEQETYLIRLITPLQSNTEARLLVKSWHACRKSANLNHLMAHLDDRYEPALISARISIGGGTAYITEMLLIGSSASTSSRSE